MSGCQPILTSCEPTPGAAIEFCKSNMGPGTCLNNGVMVKDPCTINLKESE